MPDLLAEWREEEKKKSKTLAYKTIGCAMKVYSKFFVVGKGFEKVKNLRYNGDIPEWLYYNG